MAALATPSQLASSMQTDVDTSTATLLLDQASAFVRKYCRWHIAPAVTETITVDGSGGPVLQLPSLRVTAVTSVVELGVELVEGTDYYWSANGYLTRPYGGYWGWWTAAPRGVEVSLTHGYDLVDVADVLGVVLGLATDGMSSPRRSTRYQTGGESESFDFTSLSERDRTVLDAYRIP